MKRDNPKERLSGLFFSRAHKFSAAAKLGTLALAPGLAGFSRFYATLASQQRAIEECERRDVCTPEEQAREEAWENEGGSNPQDASR
jgi:hypothetical protein